MQMKLSFRRIVKHEEFNRTGNDEQERKQQHKELKWEKRKQQQTEMKWGNEEHEKYNWMRKNKQEVVNENNSK